MDARETLVSRLVAGTAVLSWALANGLDVLSVLFAIQFGGSLAIAPYHPAEAFLIYAGLRLLGTLGVALAVVFVSKRWPSASSAAWAALTAWAFVTAIVAWVRLYQ